ncbi:MAG TPA: DUF2845 domain-containing protein [Gammaproteobacteria bacterium]
MPSKSTRVALAALLLLAFAAPAHAFRCGSRIITRGDPAEKVLQYCGEPVAVTTRLKQRSYFMESGVRVPRAIEEVVVEEWTYNLGPRLLMRVVLLENGYVEEVKHLGYGY